MNSILQSLAARSYTGAEIDELLGSPTSFPSELVEKLSIETALNFWKGLFTFDEGDYIMNNLHSYWFANEAYCLNHEFPRVAYDCYLAFDDGEHLHGSKDSSIDPVELYTKPQIKELLKELKLI